MRNSWAAAALLLSASADPLSFDRPMLFDEPMFFDGPRVRSKAPKRANPNREKQKAAKKARKATKRSSRP